MTLGTDGEPGAALSNTNLQEAAGPVHGENSASTLDSLIQLCDSHVCDTHQTLRLLPISMNVSVRVLCWRGRGAVGRVKKLDSQLKIGLCTADIFRPALLAPHWISDVHFFSSFQMEEAQTRVLQAYG